MSSRKWRRGINLVGVTNYDLIVVGAGSGNMLFGPELQHLHGAIVEQDRLLIAEDVDISTQFIEMAHERFALLLDARVTQVAPGPRGVSVTDERGEQIEQLPGLDCCEARTFSDRTPLCYYNRWCKR